MNIKKIVLLVISFATTSLILFTFLNVFSVKKVHIIGEKNISEIHAYDFDFLPLVNIKKAEEELYIRNPAIKKIKVIKKYPDTLEFISEKSDPVAQLPSSSGFFLLNDAARIVQKTTSEPDQQTKNLTKLASINYYQKLHDQEYSVGDEIDKQDLRYALAFLGRIKTINIEIETIDITSPNMIVLINAQQRYLITIEKDIELQFQELKIVYERLLQKGEKYSQIDVRFEKPIITF